MVHQQRQSHIDSGTGWRSTTETQSPPAPLPQRQAMPVVGKYDKIIVALLTVIAIFAGICAIGVAYWTITLIEIQAKIAQFNEQLTQIPGLGG